MKTPRPRILIAPDSLKGSLSSQRFCEIGAGVLQRHLPDAEITTIPLADGGEGTVDALLHAAGGELVQLQVRGPVGKRVRAHYGLLQGGKTAVIEMAQAAGLPMVPRNKRNPAHTSSFGVGELIADALEKGVRHIILGLGGSATNDGGTGALQALGARFLDKAGNELDGCGESLSKIASIDVENIHPLLSETEFVIASDVNNPLLGEHGATFEFGPQKGADSETLNELEAGMAHFADLLDAIASTDFRGDTGTGAAGGMAYSFVTLFNARLHSGFQLIAESAGLVELLASTPPDLIISAEGEINSQSLNGKLVGRIAEMAKKHQVPLLVLTGSIQAEPAVLYDAGITNIRSIVTAPMTLSQAMKNSETLVGVAFEDIGMWLKAFPPARRI